MNGSRLCREFEFELLIINKRTAAFRQFQVKNTCGGIKIEGVGAGWAANRLFSEQSLNGCLVVRCGGIVVESSHSPDTAKERLNVILWQQERCKVLLASRSNSADSLSAKSKVEIKPTIKVLRLDCDSSLPSSVFKFSKWEENLLK